MEDLESTKIHLCDSCVNSFTYPDCLPSDTVNDVEFVLANDLDNIIKCTNYGVVTFQLCSLIRFYLCKLKLNKENHTGLILSKESPECESRKLMKFIHFDSDGNDDVDLDETGMEIHDYFCTVLNSKCPYIENLDLDIDTDKFLGVNSNDR